MGGTRLDQPTRHFHNRRNESVNRNRRCLKVVDRFRLRCDDGRWRELLGMEQRIEGTQRVGQVCFGSVRAARQNRQEQLVGGSLDPGGRQDSKRGKKIGRVCISL